MDEKKDKEFDAIQQLEDLCRKIKKRIEDRGKKFYGFPINLPYTDYESVWDHIQATGIQQYLEKDLEYVVAVQCFQYKNYIISTWIFLAVLLPEDI